MDQVNSTGFTGNRAKFTIDLPHHSLSFTTKLPQVTSSFNVNYFLTISNIFISDSIYEITDKMGFVLEYN